MKTFFIFFLILLAASSCKTSFRISVQKPAIIRVPFQVEKFGVVNHVTNENSPEKVIIGALVGENVNGNILASEGAADGVLRGLAQSNSVSGIVVAVDQLKGEDGSVNWTHIDTMCCQLGIHAIIELNEIRTNSPTGGQVVATATGQSSMRLDGTLISSIYIANSHEAFERLNINRSYNVPMSGGTSLAGVFSDIARKRQYYRALGVELGYGVGRLVYPNWIWVNRNYYTKGCRELKSARPMIREGNWGIAEKQLLLAEDHRKNKIRGRVLFNLALVKEGQGEIEAAIGYAEKAALECGNKLANDYLRDLYRRREQLNQM